MIHAEFGHWDAVTGKLICLKCQCLLDCLSNSLTERPPCRSRVFVSLSHSMLWPSSAEKRNDCLSQQAKLSVQMSRPTSHFRRPINGTERRGVIDNDIEIDCLNPLPHRVPQVPKQTVDQYIFMHFSTREKKERERGRETETEAWQELPIDK